MCQVGQDNIDEFSIVGCQSEGQDGNFVVDMQVRNDGDQETDLFDYEVAVTPYDGAEASDSNNIDAGGQSTSFPEGSVVQPGDTRLVVVRVALIDSASPSDVALYTATVKCGTFSDGVYCE